MIKKIVIISNYKLDGQESMLRYAKMVNNIFLEQNIRTKIWYPTQFFGSLLKNDNPIYKWLAYIDKWIFSFPILILKRFFASSDTRYLICDHSNSPYINALPRKRTIIVCHDLLAVRGALGFKDSYCESSKFGIYLQKWILKNLIKIPKIAVVSELSLSHLLELSNCKASDKPNWRVIYNTFNESFKKLPENVIENILAENKILLSQKFILHVGSNLSRKNRELIIECLNLVSDKNLYVCFAGAGLNNDLKILAKKNKVENKIIEIKHPNHELLEALYNKASIFIFPSFSEGFGWPIIEAQACGVSIIASNVAPLKEIGGLGAIYCNPYSPEDFANAINNLLADSDYRNQIINYGLENTHRFKKEIFFENFMKLYNS